MRTFVMTGVALLSVAGAHAGLQQLIDSQSERSRRQAAVADLLANPVGPAFLQMMTADLRDESGELLACAIFDADTSPAYVEKRLNKLRQAMGPMQYQLNDRWGGFGFGDVPVDLTYSFPPDGTSIGNFVESAETTSAMFSRWDAAFGGTNGSVWKPFFRQAFDRWEELTGNRYTEVTDDGASWPFTAGPFNGSPGRGDIRIVSALDDGPSGTLAFNFFPDTGDMLLDSADLAASRYLNPNNNYRFLRNVIEHEHGHGVGLSHVEPVNQTKLMEPFISTAYDGMQVDDRLGGQRTYGDTFEPNESTGASSTSSQTGIVVNVSTPQFLSDVSISNPSDQDHYRIVTTSGAYELSVTASPISGTYMQGPQGGTATLYDPSQGVDLQLEVVDNSGTVMQSKNDNGLGAGESISALQLANPGSYHIRVKRATGTTFNDIQGYTMAVTIQSIGFSADISGDGCVDGADLAILLAQWGPNPGAPSDLNGDGVIDGSDLAIFLTFWSPCP